MNRYAFLFALAAITFGICGCVEEVGKGINEFTGGLFESDIKTEATIAEIDAVAKLQSDVGMEEGFAVIASRNGLSVASQVHLVDPVLDKLYHETSKVKILVLLINNPDFSHQAKKKILNKLNKLKSEGYRSTVLKAINSRTIGINNNILPQDKQTIKETPKIQN